MAQDNYSESYVTAQWSNFPFSYGWSYDGKTQQSEVIVKLTEPRRARCFQKLQLQNYFVN